MSVRSESSEIRAAARILSVAGPVPARPTRLVAFYATILIFEFIAVASAAYFSSLSYRYTELHLLPNEYLPAALFIAALVSIVSIAFRHFVSIQRQPLHALLWSGLGAVALAFSFFLSTLFLLKAIGDYSRGAFVFQIVAVGVAVCLTRTISYVWLQSAIRSGLVEARHVVLIGEERYRLQFADLVRTAGIRSVASLPFPHARDARTAREFGRFGRRQNRSSDNRILPSRPS